MGNIFLLLKTRMNLLTILLSLILYSPYAMSSRAGALKSDITAAYIYNFLKFSKFPKEKCDTSVYKVAILQDEKLADILLKLDGQLLANRHKRIFVTEYSVINSKLLSSSCMLLYISPTVRNVKELLTKISDNVLTISESSGFLELGGAINFLEINNKLRWELSKIVLLKTEVKLSAQLISAAVRIVGDD